MKRNIIKVVVNIITISRIIFSLILILGLLDSIPNEIFLVVMAILFYTDRIDGFLARKFNVQTSFGATSDTISDKVLSIGLIVPLLTKYKYLYLLLVGEILIALTNIVGFFIRKDVKALMLGKIKMWILSITIIIGYACSFDYLSPTFFLVFAIFTFIVQILVLINYMQVLIKGKDKKDRFNIKSINDLLYTLFSTDYYLKNEQ